MIAFADTLARRAHALRVEVPAAVLPAFEAYALLLARWNRTVNLTALLIDPVSDDALDRLFLEPLAAAPWVPPGARTWIDVGSGGGSPAIPLKLIRPALELTMIESRGRKVAFLREVIRELRLVEARAEAVRFEELARRQPAVGTVDLVTARAVRPDAVFVEAVERVLRAGGTLLLFESETRRLDSPRLQLSGSFRLLEHQSSQLSIYTRVG